MSVNYRDMAFPSKQSSASSSHLPSGLTSKQSSGSSSYSHSSSSTSSSSSSAPDITAPSNMPLPISPVSPVSSTSMKSDSSANDDCNDKSMALNPSLNSPSTSSSKKQSRRRASSAKKSCMTPERYQHIKSLLRKAAPQMQRKRREEIKKNVEYACLCIDDAFSGRLSNGLANNSKKGEFNYFVFRFQTSTWFSNFIIVASAISTLSLFFEPYNSCVNSIFYTIFQYSLLSIFALDIALKMMYEGFYEYTFGHTWQFFFLFTTVLQLFDLSTNGCLTYTNFLRPMHGTLRARNMRRFFEIMLKKMMPKLQHSLSPILVFIMFMALISSLFFDTYIKEFSACSFLSYNWFLLIFTNDTFDRILDPQIMTKLSYLTFFLPAIFFGQRFLFSLIVGESYETFVTFVKKQVKKERLKELQGLTKTFSALDDFKQGYISVEIFNALMQKLKPGIEDEAVALYFELISGGQTEGLSILHFLNLKACLEFTITKKKKYAIGGVQLSNAVTDSVVNKALELFRAFRVPIPFKDKLTHIAARCLDKAEHISLITTIAEFDLFAFMLGLAGKNLLTLEFREMLGEWLFSWLAPLGYFQYFVGGIFLSPGFLIGILYSLEGIFLLIKHEGYIHRVFQDSDKWTYIYLFGTVGALFLAMASSAQDTQATFWELSFLQQMLQSTWSTVHPWLSMDFLPITVPILTISTHKLLLIFGAMRILRLVKVNQDVAELSLALTDLVPQMMETFILTLIISYIVGLVGHLLLGQYMEEWSTPVLALVKAQEITYMVDFTSSMEKAIGAVPIPMLAGAFFMFVLILSLLTSNIALSMILDLHANVLDIKSTKARAGSRDRLHIIFEKIVLQAKSRMFSLSNVDENLDPNDANITAQELSKHKNLRRKHLRRVWTNSSSKSKLDFNAMQMSNSLSQTMRKFISGGSESNITIEDIKSCNKYSSIDLIEFYTKRNHTTKNFSWESRFLKMVEDSECSERRTLVEGETLYTQDAPATHTYLLIEGTLRFEKICKKTTNLTVAYMTATNMLGSEALCPENTFNHSIKAETPVVVMEMTQYAVAHKVSEELSGYILHMCFKSNAELEKSFKLHNKLGTPARRPDMDDDNNSINSAEEGSAKARQLLHLQDSLPLALSNLEDNMTERSEDNITEISDALSSQSPSQDERKKGKSRKGVLYRVQKSVSKYMKNPPNESTRAQSSLLASSSSGSGESLLSGSSGGRRSSFLSKVSKSFVVKKSPQQSPASSNWVSVASLDPEDSELRFNESELSKRNESQHK